MMRYSILSMIVLLISGPVCRSDTVDGRDFDDLRVSSSVLQGPVNYHNIASGETSSGQQQSVQKTTEQITNHIGKPLVPMPPVAYQQQLQQQPSTNEFSQGKKYNNPKLASLPPLPAFAKLTNKNGADAVTAATTTTDNNNNNAGGRLAQQQQQSVSIRKATPSRSSFRLKLTPYGTCKWMTLREFKNISLDMSELIIRDADEQPCYILTMQAHLKWTEDDYFPLSNLRSLPHANKVVYDSPSDGASIRGQPLNCSLTAIAGGGTGGAFAATTTSQLFLPMLNQSFREEIKLAGDCGYLVLHTHSDGSNLNVEAFSYYQNSDVPIQVPQAAGHHQPRTSTMAPSRRTSSRIDSHQVHPEFLVFSTEGTYSPLISMPLISRYICQNRIVLTGRNNVQLVLDRFELQRLSYPLGEIIMTKVQDESYQHHNNLGAKPKEEAHLKWTEDDYFPLSNLRSLPHANKVVYDSPSDGASIRGQPLNCSLTAIAGGGTGGAFAATTTSQLFLPMLNQSFREEIKLAGDCGYLVLHTHSDGSNLNVEAFSYYQNSDVPIQVPQAAGHHQPRTSTMAPSRRTSSRIDSHQVHPEFLVFSTEGTYSPLISMPLISRYICQNRIVLTGRNNVQLVLDRFELQRLSYPLGEIIMTKVQDESYQHHNNLGAKPKEESHKGNIQRRSLRVLRDLTQVRRSSPFAMVTRCPMPSSPTTPLRSMMDLDASRSNNHANGNVISDNWARHQQSPNGAQGVTGMLCGQVVTVNYILAIYLVSNALQRYKIFNSLL